MRTRGIVYDRNIYFWTRINTILTVSIRTLAATRYNCLSFFVYLLRESSRLIFLTDAVSNLIDVEFSSRHSTTPSLKLYIFTINYFSISNLFLRPNLCRKYSNLGFGNAFVNISANWSSLLTYVTSILPLLYRSRIKWYYCDQIERWILNLNFPGFSKLKFFFSP